jgi:hypothetical protein
MDVIHRLNALANGEHDDLSIGYEAAEAIIDLRAEIAEQAQEIERLESLVRSEKNYWKQVGMNYEKRKQAMQQIINGQQKQIEGLASFHQSEAALAAKGDA